MDQRNQANLKQNKLLPDIVAGQEALEDKIIAKLNKQFKGVARQIEATLKRADNVATKNGTDTLAPSTALKAADAFGGGAISIPPTDYVKAAKLGGRLAVDYSFDRKFPNQKALQALKNRADWLSKTVSQDRAAAVRDIVAQGIEDRQSYRVVQAKINDYLGINGTGTKMTPSQAIARTETQWAVQEGRRQSFLDIGVQLVDISTAIDACQECIDIAESGPYNITDAESLLPVHPNCRCSLQINWESFNGLSSIAQRQAMSDLSGEDVE